MPLPSRTPLGNVYLLGNQRNECESSGEVWYMGYLDCLERTAEKVPICNPLKKLLISSRELRNLITHQLVYLPIHIFPTIVFRKTEEDTEEENQEIRK